MENHSKQLQEFEEARLLGLVEGDPAERAPMYAEEFQLISPQGMAVSKSEYLGLLESGD